jgi:TctA family transporter
MLSPPVVAPERRAAAPQAEKGTFARRRDVLVSNGNAMEVSMTNDKPLGKSMAKSAAIGALIGIPVPFIGPVVGAAAGAGYAYFKSKKRERTSY